MTFDFTTIFIGAVISGLIGAAIGSNKGRGGAGLFLGFLLGPLGWILVAVGPDNNKKPDEKSPYAAQKSPQPTVIQISSADRILSLKRLLDAGAITAIEYQEKKATLLASL
jgi:hypothetical protein